jgi:hypothetical protein
LVSEISFLLPPEKNVNISSLITITFSTFKCNLLRYTGNQMQEMSSAAQGYYKVVEENRKLYNMVQDLKGRKQLTQVLLF